MNEIDAYITRFPEATQQLLEQMRQCIKKSVPEAIEKISYQIPTFYLKGNLVHFAGYKDHIGFYPGESAIRIYATALSIYKGAKGSVQFPLNQPLPLTLIEELVKFRVTENLNKDRRK